ncbi:M23 family metallopeptidase [Sphingomonas sp.]|uniref:M23 family metallopeptidase n=1 Tax=Sphingomonas sp. TaxID=28214 RepID=UPI00286B0F00|nr:M23 family metallopeptidase [Sphingomonas sp.]
MAQTLAATPALSFFRDRDLFIHDGTKLRRFRLSAPVQAFFFVIMMTLVAWSGYAAARMIVSGPQTLSLSDATEARAQKIEQRQALIEAIITGKNVDDAAIAAATAGGRASGVGPLARVEDAQMAQAALIARALDVRYQTTAAELKKLGLTPSRVAAVGGPFEAVGRADPTFKQLFSSWKKLETLQDGAIAIPSDKPVQTAAFTSGFGVRSDPFHAGAAMHPGIDLAGPMGTPVYATADGTVMRAGWNSGGYGNLVELDHGRGIATRYGHMSAILVNPGDHITRGQQIGRMGSTGRSTGCHLHYEVRIDGRPVNPVPFMKATDYLVAMQRKANAAPMEQIALGGPTGGARR